MASLAERLGYAAEDRIAIVHVDDLGMAHAANAGGFEALRRGPATCGSIMVPCPWFREAANLAAAEPELDLGVHLTLNAEWEHFRWGPVAGRTAVPSLLDDEGYLPRTIAEVAQRAKPAEVEVELRAQIEKALGAGIDVTHLDTHMGSVFLPALVPIYAELAEEYRLPVFAARPTDEELERRGLGGLGPVLDPLLERLRAAGIPTLDGFCADSLEFEAGKGLEHNRRRLDRLGPGVHYVICHASRAGAELERITPDSAHQRDFERTFWGGEAGRSELAARGFHTIGMRELRDLVRAEGPGATDR